MRKRNPLGLDVEESRALAEVAQAAGVHAAIGLQARANPAVRRAHDLLDAGAIGRPLSARILSTTAGFGPDVAQAFAYTEDPANGVTVITIQAAHTIDLAIALLGGLADMTALASTQFPTIRIGDGQPQSRRTSDHLMIQGRRSGGAALSIEVAGGRTATTAACSRSSATSRQPKPRQPTTQSLTCRSPRRTQTNRPPANPGRSVSSCCKSHTPSSSSRGCFGSQSSGVGYSASSMLKHRVAKFGATPRE